MFDVSFFELIVIVVVALIVIGPEKLPKVARTLGAMTGRMQRYMAQVKEEVNREVRFEELQALQSEIKAGVDKTQRSIQHKMDDVTSSLAIEQNPQLIDATQVQALDEVQALDLVKPVKKRVRKSSVVSNIEKSSAKDASKNNAN